MKNFVIAVILTAALITLFSWIDYRQQMFDCINYWQPTEPTGNGSGTKRKGDSGLIIPGDGESPADTFIEPESIPEPPEDEQEVGTQMMDDIKTQIGKIKNGITQYIPEEITMEELNKMDITAFWHGVAAVLIGEASTLMVAFAWMKIRGGK